MHLASKVQTNIASVRTSRMQCILKNLLEKFWVYIIIFILEKLPKPSIGFDSHCKTWKKKSLTLTFTKWNSFLWRTVTSLIKTQWNKQSGKAESAHFFLITVKDNSTRPNSRHHGWLNSSNCVRLKYENPPIIITTNEDSLKMMTTFKAYHLLE